MKELRTCGAQVAAAIQGSNLAGGFVLPNLVRFLAGEAAYLSTTRGGPTMFLNLEDDLAGSTGAANARFQARGLFATNPAAPCSLASGTRPSTSSWKVLYNMRGKPCPCVMSGQACGVTNAYAHHHCCIHLHACFQQR